MLIKEQGATIRQLQQQLSSGTTQVQPSPPQPPRTTVVRLDRVDNLRGWLSSPTSVYVGATNEQKGLKGSKWQNPYQQELWGEKCLGKFEASIRNDADLVALLVELRGKELGCLCPPTGMPCHAEVLIKLLDEFHGEQNSAGQARAAKRALPVTGVIEAVCDMRRVPSSTQPNINDEANGATHAINKTPYEYRQDHTPTVKSNKPATAENPFIEVTHQKRKSSSGSGRKRVVLLIDSNRSTIDFSALFPEAEQVKVVPCSNIPSAHNEVQRGFSFPPTDIVLHVGTNDTDIITPDAVAEGLEKLAVTATRTHGCDVHLSLLTPRNDKFSGHVIKTNQRLKANASRLPTSIKIVDHKSISVRHLRDAKHLNRYAKDSDQLAGTQLFSRELYASVMDASPSYDTLAKSRKWRSVNRGGGRPGFR